MDKNEKELQEQEASLKNTDNAYVQVDKDGSPAFPQAKEEDDTTKPAKATDLDKR